MRKEDRFETAILVEIENHIEAAVGKLDALIVKGTKHARLYESIGNKLYDQLFRVMHSPKSRVYTENR